MPTPSASLTSRQRLVRAWGAVLLALGLSAVSLAAAGTTKASDPVPAVLAAARAHLGDTYTWAATGPDTWDCSGFTSTLWHDAGGVNVPRTSRQQQAWAVPLPVEQALPGDLVFFGDPVTHVGLVVRHVTRRSGQDLTHLVTMIDASSSQKGVVERQVWTSGTVRFGRVPRKGMPKVTPWTAPSPAPAPTPSSAPGSPAAPGSKAAAAPVPAPVPVVARPLSATGALLGLPAAQAAPSSAVAVKAARLARAAVGNTRLTDAGLVANVWHRAGGAALPVSRAALVARAHRVPLSDARVGDLVVYAAPGSHVGVYVGNGLMVDASRSLGSVVLRPVWSAPGVQLVRLRG